MRRRQPISTRTARLARRPPARALWRFALALPLLGLGACHDRATQPAPAESPTAGKSAEPLGWRDYRLGMFYTDTKAADAGMRWDPYTLGQCQDRMAIAGCTLRGADDGGELAMIDGIPFRVALAFNKHGVLTDVQLDYRKSGAITRAQCLDLLGRSYDWLSDQVGGLTNRASPRDKAHTVRIVAVRTPAGHMTNIGGPPGSQDYVSSFAFSGKTEGARRTTPYAWIFGSFIVAGDPHCDINIAYSAPDAVERGAP